MLLDLASFLNTLANLGGSLGRCIGGQLVVIDRGDGEVQIDAVEDGSGDFLGVSGDLGGMTDAGALGVTEEAARTGILRSYHDEFGRVSDGALGARDGDLTIFQWLAERFED